MTMIADQAKQLQIISILRGHSSMETAYVVDDYPYGGLRCQMRFWLETNNRGTRLMKQTNNPKRYPAIVWNNPKASTYSAGFAFLYLDENNHVQWIALSNRTDPHFFTRIWESDIWDLFTPEEQQELKSTLALAQKSSPINWGYYRESLQASK